MRPLFPLVAIVSTAVLSQFSWAADADKSSVTDSAIAVLSGNDSHISKPTFRRVESAAEWKKTWLDHLGHKEDTIYRPAMEIDFNRCIVVAIFGGKTTNSCGYRVESVRENDNEILTRITGIRYQTAGPNGGADSATPYCFIVLPKSEKPIVLEETTYSMNAKDAAVSREVARLNAAEK